MPTGGNDFGSARLRFSTRLTARMELLQRFLYRNYQSTRTAIRSWLAHVGFVDSSRLSEETVEVFTTCAQQGGAEYAIRNYHAGRLNLNLESRIGSLTQPVTLFWGNEPGYPAMESGQRLQALAKNCCLILLPRVGALAALEDPASMGAALNEQLDSGLRVVKG
jgi:hypothetical protein